MAGTVVTDQAEVHDCDAVSDWTGSPTLDTETFIEGTGSLSAKISKSTATFMKPLASNTDLSDTIIYAWVLGGAISQFDTKANGGIRIRVESGVTPDYGEWYIAGNDSGYAGGWQCLTVRTTATLNSDGGVDLSIVNAVGVVFKVTATAAKINCWWDRIAYGTSLTVYGGTDVSPASLSDIVSAEATNKYGIVIEVGGVLMAQGKIIIGSTTAGVDTYFLDKGSIVVFRDRSFGTFYEIKGQGNSTGDTRIYFGEKASGKGISGSILKSEGADKFTVTMTDTNIDYLGLYGSLFLDAGTVTLPPFNANKEVLNCNFEECAEIIADTCLVQYCNIINADARGIRLASTSHYIKDCNFINCPHCMHITLSTGVTFDNLQFSGSDGSTKYDIEHSVSGTLTIAATNGSNPNSSYVDETAGGNTVINNAVNITVTVKDESNVAIENAQVAIYKTSDATVLMNEDTLATGVATESFNYATDTDIYIRIRKSSSGITRYFPVATTGTITSAGFDLTVVMKQDSIVAS